MKREIAITAFSALAVAFCFSISGCEKPSLKSKEKDVSPKKENLKSETNASAPEVTYPIERSISNSQGSKTEVAVIGKEGGNITFLRKSDGGRFVFSISKLSKEDQMFFSSLPDRPAPEAEKKKSNYVAFREKEIERLENELDDLRSQKSKGVGKLKARGITRDIKRIQSKIGDLESQIKNHEK